jgi:hypothetical protein
MTGNDELAREKRKQTRLGKLGTNKPICPACGETDWRCMELHHVAGQKLDAFTVIVCLNCHRKLTDDQKDHPKTDDASDPLLNQIGHFLLGLADMLKLVVEKLTEFGGALIERAGMPPAQQPGGAS